MPSTALQELREALGVDCTLVAIHYLLIRLGLTHKKGTPRGLARVAGLPLLRVARSLTPCTRW